MKSCAWEKVVRHVHGWYDGRAGCIIEPLGDNWCSENFCGGKKRLKRTKREIHWSNKKKERQGVYPILLVHLNEGTVFCQVVASTTATGRHLLSQFVGHFHSYFYESVFSFSCRKKCASLWEKLAGSTELRRSSLTCLCVPHTPQKRDRSKNEAGQENLETAPKR